MMRDNQAGGGAAVAETDGGKSHEMLRKHAVGVSVGVGAPRPSDFEDGASSNCRLRENKNPSQTD